LNIVLRAIISEALVNERVVGRISGMIFYCGERNPQIFMSRPSAAFNPDS